MTSVSALGDAGFDVTAVLPLSTSTAEYYTKTSGTSTGTKATTSRSIDLSRVLQVGSTGGKFLDGTVHPRISTIGPVPKSIKLTVPLKVTFLAKSVSLFVTVVQSVRSTTAGAGSSWAALKSETVRYKNGTSTNMILHTGFVSSVNAMAAQKLYKANLTFATRKASSTAAKDTTTSIKILCWNPIVELFGGPAQQVSVPARV